MQGLLGVLGTFGVTSTLTAILLAIWTWWGAQVFGLQVLFGAGVFLSVASGLGVGKRALRDYRKRDRVGPPKMVPASSPPPTTIEKPKATVTVEVERFTDQNIRASIQALKVTNNTESRRRFRAHAEVLYGTEHEIPSFGFKEYYLPWEGRESDAALAPGETASAFVGRLCGKLQQIYRTHQGSTTVAIHDTSLSPEDDRSIRLRVTIVAEPELPGGPVTKDYILTSGDLQEVPPTPAVWG